jgi:glyoxylase-like metal-dependent hydrolase (beta-lactamase superfamily II)
MQVYELKLRFVKSFLIENDDGNLILVDSGTPGGGRRILNELVKTGKNPERVSYVIFTHSHLDHIGGSAELRSALKNAKFGIAREGLEYLEKGKIREPIIHSTFQRVLFSIAKPFLLRGARGVRADFVLEEGELIKGVEIIKTPGHTDDSISIYLKPLNSLIVGDTLFGDREGLKVPVIYEDFDNLMKSIEKIKEFKPKMVYVSHGMSSTKFLV